MSITVETIAENRYAPVGAQSINLYATELEGGSSLTLAQLVMAVCFRSAAAYESQSVLKMNVMTAGSAKLDEASTWLKQIVAGVFEEPNDAQSALAFLTETLGISESELPVYKWSVTPGVVNKELDVSSYDKRMQAANALKEKMEALTRSQQQDMIDLQTLVNRRDVAYTTSSNIVRTVGNSMSGDATNF